MRIVNLIENTEGVKGCAYAHGLSFYIETARHKLLVDLGPSGETLDNAKKLGIDLSAVDTVILSHGHYDHSGGIMPFSGINVKAVIYMQRLATGEYYADDGAGAQAPEGGDGAAGSGKPGDDTDCGRYHYIGIDKDIAGLPQVKFIDGDCRIDDELSLFTISKRAGDVPFTNARLKEKTGEDYIPDEFRHEQYLVIEDNGRKVLISGCAHNGMVNIIEEYHAKYGGYPDAVISGFHLMKKSDYTDDELGEIIDTAHALKKYPTMFYSCHCTGIPAYRVMKNIMHDKLDYVHSGQELSVRYINNAGTTGTASKRRNTFMKCHKFFAWATVICFLLTMITGYERK